MKPIILLIVLSSVAALPGAPAEGSSGRKVPRTVLACYDGGISEDPAYTLSHTMAELPLNHLGLVVRHIDVSGNLPDPETLEDVKGVLMWMESAEMSSPLRFLDWAERMVLHEKRFVIMGNLPFSSDLKGKPTNEDKVNYFLNNIGLKNEFDWTPITYNLDFVQLDSRMVGFERSLSGVTPPFERIVAIQREAKIFLGAARKYSPETRSDLVVVTSNGGYAALGFTHYFDAGENRKRWILNPFEFFRLAFDTDEVPKADVTTHSGRRIYYSHIDGDGWRNLSEVPRYREEPTLSAEVILREAIAPFPDLPVTVGPVVADLHPDWHGTEEGREIARRFLAQPQVEVGTHTFSHPFDWGFFEDGNPEKEKPYLDSYAKSWGSLQPFSWLTSWFSAPVEAYAGNEAALSDEGYEKPRAYAVQPFDLGLEIEGAAKYLEELAPPGKKVKLIQWSGNTLPFEGALRAARLHGLQNINGGDTRFDRDYSSVAWVAPVGRLVGNERQIYASNSNENTYTDLWRDRYFGFIHLIRTFENTETPLRLKPLNVYYHIYSGERLSSLKALLANLEYVRTRRVCPLDASRYAAIGEGFFTTEFAELGPERWRVMNRGLLQTLRFDHATYREVDFERSEGLVGQRHYQGSLYVSLDRTHPGPIVALKKRKVGSRLPEASLPYLIDSRWDIWGVESESDCFRFKAQGYGVGEMLWKVRDQGLYRVLISGVDGRSREFTFSATGQRTLDMRFDVSAIHPVRIEVSRE